MTVKRSALATAIAGCLVVGVSSPVAAAVYAGSKLDISDFRIVITAPPQDVIIGDNYTFSTNADATLNGATIGDFNQCVGGTCGVANPVITSVASVPGAQRLAGDFTIFGPGLGNSYSTAASEITTSELTSAGADPSRVQQISEVSVVGTGAGAADTSVDSETKLEFNFTIGQTADLLLNFTAYSFMRTFIDTLDALSFNAQVRQAFTLGLEGDGLMEGLSWTPTGANFVAGCFPGDVPAGVSCTALDGFNLNSSFGLPAGVPPLDTERERTGDFALSILGLGAGNYTLTIGATTFASVRQEVPEPGVLALFGLGLAFLGFAANRRRFS
ncbi:EDSAP-1 family PEP-CTERM protein [Ectothiorhodospira lacustris]|uniref:EDSAP-1 family PEP-CTERM protein n=1 Tax=Ectothiorhodospira lacustris TaxID=2899127 RepID=UPI001EE7EEFB|nr:EDSAP-1 family PEP-CTERM protein [Ectothiorhodospira lacustris]MCG5510852.1 PEP-CTERM sorting domain-containing protein [Ectothiorhodospira lacustris]MCG5522602.1 PEP-CTERM sorting domain-containing protein [Ectothiorhodospira lacustris]